MSLTSKLFTADPPAVRNRLERCLISNPDHIVPQSRGPEVARIQTALSILGSVAIDPQELEQQFYGKTTVDAVLAFKSRGQILNYEGQIDPIVGIKTLTALDAMMADFEKRNAPPPPAPPPPVVGTAGVQIGPLGTKRHIVESYYLNCRLETIGPGQVETAAIRTYATFDELLDVLLARYEVHQVIVNHGNRFKGLIIPFATGSPFDGTGNVAGELSILADQETQGTLDPKNLVF